MKAIKIDAENQLIGMVELSSDYKDIYKVLGLNCTCFTAPILFDNGDTVYVDDEGLLHGPAPCGFTMLLPDGTFWQFVGNGIILGCDDEEGSSCDVKGKIEDYVDLIGWLDRTTAGVYQVSIGY